MGRWKIHRLIDDRLQVLTGQLDGQAEFTPYAGGLLYWEHGTLAFGEHRGAAEQSYHFDFADGDSRAFVRFRDGSLFHALDLSAGQDLVLHACHPDLYRGRYVVLSGVQWRSAWTVKGPRKDYQISTMYTRT